MRTAFLTLALSAIAYADVVSVTVTNPGVIYDPGKGHLSWFVDGSTSWYSARNYQTYNVRSDYPRYFHETHFPADISLSCSVHVIDPTHAWGDGSGSFTSCNGSAITFGFYVDFVPSAYPGSVAGFGRIHSPVFTGSTFDGAGETGCDYDGGWDMSLTNLGDGAIAVVLPFTFATWRIDHASFTLLFSSPLCPCDRNNDYAVTVDDLILYLADYADGVIQADTNFDGGVTIEDLLNFLTAYERGC